MNCVADGPKKLPTGRTLALGSETSWARVAGCDWRKQFWRNRDIGTFKTVQNAFFKTMFLLSVTRRARVRSSHCSFGRGFNCIIHYVINRLFVVVPCNGFNERKPTTRKPNLNPSRWWAMVNNWVWEMLTWSKAKVLQLHSKHDWQDKDWLKYDGLWVQANCWGVKLMEERQVRHNLFVWWGQEKRLDDEDKKNKYEHR
jgi:hypothetical protein